MRRLWSRCGRSCLLLALTLCSASVGRAQVIYTDFGAPPGASNFSTGVTAINASGQIVGSFTDGYPGKTHSFLLSAGVFTTIDVPFPGAYYTIVTSINASGQIVGYYLVGAIGHGFLWSGGSFTTIDIPGGVFGTVLMGINDSGQITGAYTDALTEHAFLLSGGNLTVIDGPNAFATQPVAINASGQIAGFYTDLNQIAHGFLFSGGNVTTIDPPGAYALESNIAINGMNASGQVVGGYRDAAFRPRSFLFSAGSYTTIDPPADVVPGTSPTVNAINASGQMVGTYLIQGASHSSPFLFSAGGYTTIDPPADVHGSVVYAINDSGQMAGWFVDAFNVVHIFLASLAITLVDPIPSPGNPSLIDDHGVMNKPDLLAASTQTVQGVAADGTTQVAVRVPDKGGNVGDIVTLTLLNDQVPPAPSTSTEEDGYFSSLDGALSKASKISEFTIVTTASPDPMAFMVYHAPIDFARPGNPSDPGAKSRTINIQVDILNRNGSSVTVTTQIQIVRPPLALIHGLWSKRTTWDFFDPLVLPNGKYDPRFQVLRVDYQMHNGDHVDDILKSSDGSSPFDQLPEYLTLFKQQQNVAAVQFDVVGHSMGGLVTRDMALDPRFLANENYHRGMVHKLITIGSPHNGSPLVNELNQSSFICKIIFGTLGQKIAGAAADLSVGSPFLARLNGSSTLPLKAHAIVGIANPVQELDSQTGLGLITKFVCSNILKFQTFQLLYRQNGGSGNSDLLVPQESQSFGFFPASTTETISNSIHSVGPIVFPEGPDELNRVLSLTEALTLNPIPSSDPTIDPNRVINGLNTPISDTTYWADIKP